MGRARSVWATLGLPPLTACSLSWSTLLSSSRLLCRGTVQSRPWVLCTRQVSAAQAQVLRCSTKAQTWLGISCPGQSSSDIQVLGECPVPGGLYFSHLPCPRRSLSWVRHKSADSGALCISSGELICGCDPSGRCQPSRIPGRLV